MPTHGDRSDVEVCTVLRALQGWAELLGPDATPHLATLAASDEEVAIWLWRVGLPTRPPDRRPSPFLLAPVLHMELRNEMREGLASLSWGKAEMKATVVRLLTGAYFPAGIPDSMKRNVPLEDSFVQLLTAGIAGPGSVQRPLSFSWTRRGARLDVLCQPWAFQPRAEGGWEPVAGLAVGTCYRNTSLPQSTQLFNTYTQHHSCDGATLQQLIRHSVIDSEDRADMLVALLRQLDLGRRPRVRMLNLLTRRQGEEEALWQQQQAQMEYLKQQLASNDIQLIHLSYQANANCNYNFWNKGEDANTTSNAAAWLKYAEWLLTDWLRFAESHGLPGTMQSVVTETLHAITTMLLMPIKAPNRGAWFFSRVSLEEKGPAQYGLLQQLANRTLPAVEQAIRGHYLATGRPLPDTPLLAATQTLCRLIRSQYPPSGDQPRHANDAKPLSRISEFLCLALLDRFLGVVSCMNCKSGCDRSGLVHALTAAANIVYDNHPDHWEREVFAKVCGDFDGLAEVVDDHAATFEKFVASVAQWERGLRGETDLSLVLVSELRNWMFVVLMDIGWRINVHSTGLAGLKFHLGTVSANPHVTATLPPFVIGKVSAVEEGYEVIPVHRKLNLSRRVAEFLNGASQFRGA